MSRSYFVHIMALTKQCLFHYVVLCRKLKSPDLSQTVLVIVTTSKAHRPPPAIKMSSSTTTHQNLSQDEIISGTREVIKGLEQLKNEHNDILNNLYKSLKVVKKDHGDSNLVEEKTGIIEKSLETLELGLGEARVSVHVSIIKGKERRSKCPFTVIVN